MFFHVSVENHDFMFFWSFLFLLNIVSVFINLVLVYRLMFPALGKLRCVFVQPNIKQLTSREPLFGKGGLEEKCGERSTPPLDALEPVAESCPSPLAGQGSCSW